MIVGYSPVVSQNRRMRDPDPQVLKSEKDTKRERSLIMIELQDGQRFSSSISSKWHF